MKYILSRQVHDNIRRYAKSISKLLPTFEKESFIDSEEFTHRIDRNTYLCWSSISDEIHLWQITETKNQSIKDSMAPFRNLSKHDARKIGIPDEKIPIIKEIKNIEDLSTLDLSEEILTRLQFRFLQLSNTLSDRDKEFSHKAINSDHFNKFLHGRIHEVLLHLDEQQNRIVNLKTPGTIVVRGVAGSGKTSVALHRIYNLVANNDMLDSPNIIFFTFNRSLTAVASELSQFLGIDSNVIKFSTFHAWCVDFLGKGFNILNDRDTLNDSKDKQRLIHSACETIKQKYFDSAIWRYPDGFWLEEIHLIRSRITNGFDEYRLLKRRGAGRKLDPKLRKIVWEVLQEYLNLCRNNNLVDFDDIVQLAYRKMENNPEYKNQYHYIFIDEAQDLTVLAFKILKNLCTNDGNLFITFDAAQSIYERNFYWKDCDIKVDPHRSFTLKNGFRNSREIMEWAKPLWKNVKEHHASQLHEIHTDDEMPLEPDLPTRHGNKPQLFYAAANEEYRLIAHQIKNLIISDNVPLNNVAVLFRQRKEVKLMYNTLRQADIECQMHSEIDTISLSNNSVKILTLYSAKGLEFPVVFILVNHDSYNPPKGMREEDEEREIWAQEMKRLLYMGMTRSMNKLILVARKYQLTPHLDYLKTNAIDMTKLFTEQMVYTKDDIFYHKPNCRRLTKCAHPKSYDSSDIAQMNGLIPCTICKPS